MSLIDDAKRLSEHNPICGCGSGWYPEPCPKLAIPSIVAALEAAAAFVAVNGKDNVTMAEFMRIEDDFHAAFGDERRYAIPESSPIQGVTTALIRDHGELHATLKDGTTIHRRETPDGWEDA